MSAVNNAAAAVPKLADQMVEGAKKGFTQMGRDAFGTTAPTAETIKYDQMLKQRRDAQNAASGTSPLIQPSTSPQGSAQVDTAAAAEEEARRLKEQELASAE